MKRVFVVAVLMIAALSFGLIQRAEAGGSGFTSLSFPNANRKSCGFWEVSGGAGQVTSNWVAMYSLVDGNGKLLAHGGFTQFPANGTIRGTFDVQPKANPIHFIAVAYYRGDVYKIGDLYANEPCLSSPPSPTSTPTLNFVPTNTVPPVPTQYTTPVPPGVWIGCSQTIIEGYIANPITTSVRAEVSLSSDLNVKLATQVAPINGNTYQITLYYPEQYVGTLLVVSVGEWDGTNYVRPAFLTGGPCVAGAATPDPTLIPTITPTVIMTETPVPASFWIGCSQTIIQGYIANPLTPYMRASVNLASDLSVNLATEIVPINSNSYSAKLSYPEQPAGTRLIVALGQWDGTQVVTPGFMTGGDCIGATPTPVAPMPTTTP